MASNISSFGVRIAGFAPLLFVWSSLRALVIALFWHLLGRAPHCPGRWRLQTERKSGVFVLDTIPLIMLKSFKIVHNSPHSWLSGVVIPHLMNHCAMRKPSAPAATGSGRAVATTHVPGMPNRLETAVAFSISLLWPRENKYKKQIRVSPRNAQKKWTENH